MRDAEGRFVEEGELAASLYGGTSYPDDVDWAKARKFSLVHGGTKYVEGRKQSNKSMQAELVYVREKKTPMSTQSRRSLQMEILRSGTLPSTWQLARWIPVLQACLGPKRQKREPLSPL